MQHPSFHARRTPDKVAYQMAGSGEALTYAELDARSNQGAHVLRGLGVGVGDNIALMMENRLEFMEVCWAAHRSGIIYTAVSRHLSSAEAAHIVEDCGARVVILSDALADRRPEIEARLSRAVTWIGVGESPGNWRERCAAAPTAPVADAFAGKDMLYSSGTTGRPKGVAISFERQPVETISPLLVLLCQTCAGMDENTVYLSPAPLYHAAPLRWTMMSASLGGTGIIMERFDAETFLKLIREHQVTVTQVVPTMFVRILKLPADVRAAADVSSLKCCVHAAAPCPVDVKRQIIEWWGPIVLEYYAGTEANGFTVVESEEWLAHPGTVGRAQMGRIVIADDEGRELHAGNVGKVYFDTGMTFEYRGDPEKTARAFLRPGCGTLGDVGRLDEEGYLYLTDRADYMIISGGVNIYPQETEDALICHPDVLDAAVFGVPNEDLGEEVKAVVQLKEPAADGEAKAAELIAYVRERISPIKAPRSIDFRAELPRTPTGKLTKRLLKDEYMREATL